MAELVDKSLSSSHTFLMPSSSALSLSEESVDYVNADLLHLLQLPHADFWATMVFNKDAMMLVKEVLQLLPRDHDMDLHSHLDFSQTSKLLFLVLLRLCSRRDTNNEEKHEWSKEQYTELLRNHKLVTASLLLDAAPLLFKLNKSMASKMIENVFKLHPSLITVELPKTIRLLSDFITEEAVLNIDNLSAFDPEPKSLQNQVLAITDALVCSKCLCELSFQALKVFFDSDFSRVLASAYQQVLLPLTNLVVKHSSISSETRESLLLRLRYCRKCSISLLRQMLEQCAINAALVDERSEDTNNYLDAVSACMEEGGAILLDLDKHFHLQEDFDLLRLRESIDQTRLEYVRDGLRHLTIELDRKVSDNLAREEAKKALHNDPLKSIVKSTDKSNKSDNELVNRVKDLLPDLKISFVEKCLQYFDNDPDKVVNAFFEDNLPPHLRQAQEEQEKEKEGKEEEVANNGEYKSVVHVETWRGKRPRPRDAKVLLDDKTEVMAMRDKMIELDAEYEDEYDDTYDDNLTGQTEPDEEPLQQRILPTSRYRKRDEIEEENDDEGRGKRDAFVRDPAEVRAENERRRQQRRGGGQQQPRDVVGRAKGQGQEKQVLINRARKNANKGKTNRARNEAKMSKGMF